jgi:hypothetical protein
MFHRETHVTKKLFLTSLATKNLLQVKKTCGPRAIRIFRTIHHQLKFLTLMVEILQT